MSKMEQTLPMYEAEAAMIDDITSSIPPSEILYCQCPCTCMIPRPISEEWCGLCKADDHFVNGWQ